jgi:hypothetical protein
MQFWVMQFAEKWNLTGQDVPQFPRENIIFNVADL